ncbi:MAG: ribosomal RNA small subunit methyltransferase A [Erysipelotrichaceae bacterium]|nr:ribosomal RNA small subunit methyltransferase A [Erysipelotrichaceae bacterium]
MQIDRNTCLEILNEYGIIPSKDKGQNYLVNPDTSKRIADSLSIDKDDKVLEIGPGIGSLSHFLYEKTKNLSLIDIDEISCNVLNNIYPDIKVINEDALKADLSQYDRIISNVPYSITSDLIEHILLNATKVKQCVFMVQEDAYRRIISLKGKDYGPLSVLLSLKGKAKTLFKVSPNDFYPHPKCVSIVFKIDLFGEQVIDEKGYKIVKTLFTNRRKTLLNNTLLLMNRDKAISLLEELKLPLTVRPEEISPETYIKLVSLCGK